MRIVSLRHQVLLVRGGAVGGQALHRPPGVLRQGLSRVQAVLQDQDLPDAIR